MSIPILVTNDDGIHAEGIQALSQALFQSGKDYKLFIVAPDHERSAVGHAITMHRPLRVTEVSFMHNPELLGWSINGTPSDCVKLAVEALLEKTPAMVISGINRGSNMGNDVLYSGTVSAAVEGIVMGLPALAVSLAEGGTGEDFIRGAEFVSSLLPHLLENPPPRGTLLNINIPPCRGKGFKGVKVTRLGKRLYRNSFDRRVDPRGMTYYWLAGDLVEENEVEESDVRAILDGYISITPVHLNLTNTSFIPVLEKIIDSFRLEFR